jgi:hypothetical protein
MDAPAARVRPFLPWPTARKGKKGGQAAARTDIFGEKREQA